MRCLDTLLIVHGETSWGVIEAIGKFPHDVRFLGSEAEFSCCFWQVSRHLDANNLLLWASFACLKKSSGQICKTSLGVSNDSIALLDTLCVVPAVAHPLSEGIISTTSDDLCPLQTTDPYFLSLVKGSVKKNINFGHLLIRNRLFQVD
eukprot:Selendium_serpulae@DN5032_c1_g1_i3.p2